MNTLDIYTKQDIYEYLNVCDKIKCKVESKTIILMAKFWDTKQLIYYGCVNNIIELVNYCILAYRRVMSVKTTDKHYSDMYQDEILSIGRFACDEYIIQLFIDEGADMMKGLEYVCASGNEGAIKLIINHMIETQYKLCPHDAWDEGLCCACFAGNKKIIEMMIKNGATDFDMGLEGACRGGHKEIVMMMLDMGATNIYQGLLSARIGGYEGIMKMMDDRLDDFLLTFPTHWMNNTV